MNTETTSAFPASRLEQLPVEVRVAIYTKLPYNDILTMRLVNRQIKRELEEHLDFHLKFDQTNTTRLRRLLTLRIKSCHIVHFTSRRIQRNSSTTKIFANPSRVKKLTFDGNLSTTNLLRILNQCTTIEQLIFTHQTLGIDGLIDPVKFDRCMLRFTVLTHLHLQLLRYPQGDPDETEENVEAFLRATFPKLQSFRLYFSLWGNFSTLLPFLERHRGTLRELELQVGDRGDAHNTESYLRTNPMRISDSMRRNLLSLNLTKFRFRDDVLNLNNSAKDLFMSILLRQKQLQVLQFYSPGELSWNMLTSIINTNENFLTEVVVYNIQSTSAGVVERWIEAGRGDPVQVPERIMDMSVFSKCLHLKTLALSCSSSNGNDPNVIGTVIMKMINLNRISPSIERLHLTGFTLDGEELVSLSKKQDNNFKEVLIADAGTMRYSDVLNSFLKNCSNLCYLNVRPVVLQAANEQLWWKELEKLTKLYERFMGIQYDPIDDLEGFEANISESDKEWLKSIVTNPSTQCSHSNNSSSRADDKNIL